MHGRGLRDQSKRDSSTAWRGPFAGANEEEKTASLRSIEERFLDCVARLVCRSERGKKDRATSLGMTGLGSLVEMVAKIKC